MNHSEVRDLIFSVNHCNLNAARRLSNLAKNEGFEDVFREYYGYLDVEKFSVMWHMLSHRMHVYLYKIPGILPMLEGLRAEFYAPHPQGVSELDRRAIECSLVEDESYRFNTRHSSVFDVISCALERGQELVKERQPYLDDLEYFTHSPDSKTLWACWGENDYRAYYNVYVELYPIGEMLYRDEQHIMSSIRNGIFYNDDRAKY